MQDLFKNKNVLVTGITGFVGSRLAERLTSLGALVYGISKSKSDKRIVKTSILNYSVINEFIKSKNIHICFHLAGESLVEAGQSDPYDTFKINTEGTLNILECARKNNLERIIVASTTHVYGNNKLPYVERYTPKPSRPYETSKACTDLIAQSYADSFNLPVLIPRFVNIYGPHDLNFTRLIPKIMKQIITIGKITMWGGNAIRDFIYIDDAIDAYIKLGTVNIETIEGNRIFNFGGGNKMSIKELVDKMVQISHKDIEVERIKDMREDEIKSQYVSFTKARKWLRWKPKVSLEEGLQQCYNWYVNYFANLK